MRRATVNFIVDFVGFLIFLCLIFTGYVIRYILPPGTGGRGRELSGGLGRASIKDLWSLTRHQWGDIHYILAIIFVVLIILHILLHIGWIKWYFTSILKPKKE